MRLPARFVKAPDLTPERLGGPRIGRSQHLSERFSITKQPRLLRHHEVLGGWVGEAIGREWRRKPLAEAGLGHRVLPAAMPPEIQKLERLAAVVASLQVDQESAVAGIVGHLSWLAMAADDLSQRTRTDKR